MVESGSEPRAPQWCFHLLLGPSHSTCFRFCAALPVYPRPAVLPAMPINPLPTGLAQLPLGMSGLASLLQAPTTACVPFPPPLSSIPGPVHKSVPILSPPHTVNQMDEPKCLRPEADRPRADSEMEAQSQTDRETERQTCSRHTETWIDLKTLRETERHGDRDINRLRAPGKAEGHSQRESYRTCTRTSRRILPQRQRGM